jgi:hypothetical protein
MQFVGLVDSPSAPAPSADLGFAEEQDFRPSPVLPVLIVGGLALLLLVAVVTAVVLSTRQADPGAKTAASAPLRQAPQQAQPPRTEPNEAAEVYEQMRRAQAQAASTFFFWLWMILIFGLAYAVSVILILAWVVRDARSRAVDSPVLWLLVIVLTGWLGLFVYLASRPYGALTLCARCGNKRLEHSRRCPHCGHR